MECSGSAPSAHSGPDLPASFAYHCAVNINQTHVFIGSGNSESQAASWIANLGTNDKEQMFSRLPDMKWPRYGSGCGKITTKGYFWENIVLNAIHKTKKVLNQNIKCGI